MARLVATFAAVVALSSTSPAVAGVAFTPGRTYDVGPVPTQIVSADFNQDGSPDFATVNDNGVDDAHISLIYSDGLGGFSVTNIGNTPNARSLAAADVNGDVVADLIVANHSSSDGKDGLSVLLNGGHGVFADPVFYDLTDGNNPWGVAAIDALGLGSRPGTGADIVVTGEATGGIGSTTTMFLNDGFGTLTEQPAVPSYSGSRGITPADLNGDTHADVLEAAGGTDGGAHVLMNSAGTLTAFTSLTIPGVQDVRRVAVGDVTGNGSPDVVIPSVTSDQVYVTENTGSGFLSPPVGHPVGDAPLDAAVADLDRDGRNDLVVANSGASNNLSILLGQGNGVLAPADPLPVGTPAGAPQSVVVRDLNADGYSDLAVADTAAAKVSVFFAIPPRVDVSPTGVDFGSVELGGSTSRTITITNLGPQTVSIAVEPQITGRDQLDFEVKDWSCARNIAPDSSCTFSVAFRPGDRGSRIGSLRFRTSGIGAPDFIPLTGVATVPAVTFAQPLPNAQSVLGARSAAKSCRVPKLKGKTLGSARKLLKKARCKLGKVKKARISKKAKARIKAKVRSKHYKATTVVYKQSPKAKKRVKQNAKVTVTVRTKLKKVRKSARKR